MKQIKNIAFIMLMSMISINCFAYDIAVSNEDGITIYYNYINDNKELEVTYNRSYKGNVKIPSDVTYAGRTRKVTSIGGHAFSEDTSLTSVTIPNSVTSIKTEAFYGCSGLTSVTIPNSVTTIGSLAFHGCSRLEKVIVKDITAWCNISFGSNPLSYARHLYSDENTEITNLVIPNSVTSISDNAFNYCSGLTSVTIPNSVTSIRNNAFEGCSGLTSIIIPNSVKSIGNLTFSGCSGLTSVTIGNSVTNIGDHAFESCKGLTSVTIGNSVTSIGNYAFQECSGLKKVIVKDIAAWCNINFGNEDANPLVYARHLYSDENTEITNLVIPNSVTSIAGYAFRGCDGLTSVTIPNSVTSIGEYAFRGCSGLTSVTIPNSVTSIGKYAFYGCSGLTSVTIGNSVTTIGDFAFYGCSGLTSVTIPNSVTRIREGAFYFTPKNLLEISSYIEEPTKATGLYFSSAIYKNATLYIPKGTMEKYKSTEGWKNFVFIEEGIPSGISSVSINATEEERFNLRGEKLSAPQRGVNIIRMSDGTTKKVVVK